MTLNHLHTPLFVVALSMLALPACEHDGEGHGGGGGGDSGVTPEQTGSVAGAVTRSVAPENGGVGNVYVLVFDRNPVGATDAVPVHRSSGTYEDMNVEGASVAYSIPDIVSWDQPYYFLAFLDDNGNAAEHDPRPDMGDLVSVDNFVPPTQTVEANTDHQLDLVLSTVLPH